MERIDKIIASQGTYSRKQVKLLIRQKRIIVNGEIIKSSDIKIDENNSEILIDLNPINFKKYLYIMMNKPKGVISASKDKNMKTVIDLLPDKFKRKGMFPAGRLDKDTEGFLLITNDGDFAHNILSPKKHISKTYLATLKYPFDKNIIKKFKDGIKLKDGSICMSADVILEKDDGTPIVKVILYEGMYHQIKRMFASCGNEVINLKRIKMGDLTLDSSLDYGESRELSPNELNLISNKT